jgi:sulfide:quinone oxidoreductase
MTGRSSTEVLIAGGGVAALEAALALRALGEEHLSVELLAPESHFWYRPMAVAEPFGLGETQRFDLPDLASAAGAAFSLGALIGVDAVRHEARTSAGASIRYDALLVACGATPVPALPGALTFRGPADVGKIELLLERIAAGEVRAVAFAVPLGTVWSLPAYELALLTAAHLDARGIHGVELALVTPEDEPLRLFGPAATEVARGLLDERRVTLHTGVYPAELVEGGLRLVPEGMVEADVVVALPRLRGPRIDGLPQTLDGFVPVDSHGRVQGLEDVYAAGDVTTFPLKQGGIAAQQAEAAAETIAADAGADLEPRSFRPVLRGLLLTGRQPRYLRHEIAGGFGEESWAATEPLWWPPAKIVGRYLAPFLADMAGVESPGETPTAPGNVPVEVQLTVDEVERMRADWRDRAWSSIDDDAGQTVGDVMTAEPLVVAPEDTLGEVAEKMRERDLGAAAVVSFGSLVGILTSRDLLRACAGRAHPSEARVREWMTAEPIAVDAGTTLGQATALMTEHGIHHLPVVEGDRPVGMLGFRQAVEHARHLSIGLGF